MMKKVLYAVALLVMFSCGERDKSAEDQKAMAELKICEAQKSEEINTRQFIEDYVSDLNDTDWKSRVSKYLAPNTEEFLEQHSAFRKSFPNYKSNVKHLVVNGNEAIVWLHITANYAVTYSFDDKYIEEVLNGIEAKNQELSWDEVWYFDMIDGRFGNKWDFLKDNYNVIKALRSSK